ncbi:CopG family transcriptional regulator [Streptococcus ferus]|uniref:CopG family transcriptional regulator n=1 Tax=Streptococcus ferus TaxID=1345 RepID=UPI003518FEF3
MNYNICVDKKEVMNSVSDKPKKVGRPKGVNSNTVKLTVRISEELDSKLNKYAEDNNLTKPETLRKAFENLTK